MELLCIKTHPVRIVVFGQTYPNLGQMKCKCGLDVVNVGIKEHRTVSCQCGFEFPVGTFWVYKSRFIEIGEEQEGSQYEMVETLNK